jgi:hypothetical protein
MNLAQSDPYHIPQASTEDRLFLVRSRGALSAGTCVKLEGANTDYSKLTVSKETEQIDRTGVQRKVKLIVEVENRDLVIRKKRS